MIHLIRFCVGALAIACMIGLVYAAVQLGPFFGLIIPAAAIGAYGVGCYLVFLGQNWWKERKEKQAEIAAKFRDRIQHPRHYI